jgi:hypothetical protein
MDLNREKRHPPEELRYKTVNICSLSLKSWRSIIPELERQVVEGHVNWFYESVLADMVPDG